MRRLKLGFVTLCRIGLTACEEPENEVNWETSAECSRNNGCKVEGKIGGSFGEGAPKAADFQSYCVDTSGEYRQEATLCQ